MDIKLTMETCALGGHVIKGAARAWEVKEGVSGQTSCSGRTLSGLASMEEWRQQDKAEGENHVTATAKVSADPRELWGRDSTSEALWMKTRGLGLHCASLLSPNALGSRRRLPPHSSWRNPSMNVSLQPSQQLGEWGPRSWRGLLGDTPQHPPQKSSLSGGWSLGTDGWVGVH